MYGLDFIFERNSFTNSNGSWVLMFGNSFVFHAVTVLFTIGVVSSGETRSCPGWFENRLDSGSDWVLSFCAWDLMLFGSFLSEWDAMKYESRPCVVGLL